MELELAPIEARANAATKGPWWYDGILYIFHGGVPGKTADGILADTLECDEDVAVTRVRGVGAKLPRAANAAFIANARQDVPALVAEVKRLRDELHSIKHALCTATGRECFCGGSHT